MSDTTCILTAKDFTILEVMLERRLGRDDPMTPLLRHKLDGARVVLHDDVPPTVATLSSRVVFSVDGREPDTRVLAHDRVEGPVGLLLPITTARGLALLGLGEGQFCDIPGHDGHGERVHLEQVLYQPETARRIRAAEARLAAARTGRPALRLVHDTAPAHHAAAPFGGPDEPGPSAA